MTCVACRQHHGPNHSGLAANFTELPRRLPRGPTIAAPRLSFGAPDLQGVWSYETRTGLQRPAQYAAAGLEIDEAHHAEHAGTDGSDSR